MDPTYRTNYPSSGGKCGTKQGLRNTGNDIIVGNVQCYWYFFVVCCVVVYVIRVGLDVLIYQFSIKFRP